MLEAQKSVLLAHGINGCLDPAPPSLEFGPRYGRNIELGLPLGGQ